MPLTFPSPLLADAYFMRRLHEVRQLAASLPASVQFDIARLPYNDQDIETVVQAFGVEPPQTFGFADMMEDLMSAEPQKVPVTDIKTLQQNLKEQGYLPETYTPTGAWDNESYVGFRRMDRDAYETMKAGKRFASADLNAGIRFITNTLPPQVFQGLVGVAKGMAAQTEETLTRVGALGGGVAGAALGGTIAGPAGALVGLGVGATVGFFADLLHHSPEEEGQDISGIIDALQPFDEYARDGWGAFFEDLDYFLIAGAGLGGFKLGRMLARGGLESYGVQRAAGLTPFKALTGRASQSVEAAAGAPTAISNAITSWKATEGLPRLRAIAEGIKAKSLTGRPIFQISNGLFTGASAAQLGGRMFAGFDFQTKILDEDGEVIIERDPFTGEPTEKRTRGTKIEKAIAEAPFPQTGIDIPIFEDLAYMTAFLLQPLKFLPWGVKAVGGSLERFMGDQRLLLPAIHAMQHLEPSLGAKAAMRILREEVFGGPDGGLLWTYRWCDWAITRKAVSQLDSTGTAKDLLTFKRLRHRLIRTIREEAKEHGHSPTLTKALKEAMEHPAEFEQELIRTNGLGSGLVNMRRWRQSIDYVHDLEVELKGSMFLEGAGPDAGRMIRYMPVEQARKGKGPLARPGKTILSTLDGEEILMPAPTVRQGVDEADIALRSQKIEKLTERISTKEAILKKTPTGGPRGVLRAQIEELTQQREALKAELKALREESSFRRIGPDDMRLSIMRLEEWTKADYQGAAKNLKRLKAAYSKAIKDGNQPLAERILAEGHKQLDEIIGLRHLTPEVHAAAKANPRNFGRAVRQLQESAKAAASDVQLPAKHADYLAERGYKAVWTGEDMLFPYDLKGYVGLMDMPEWNRFAGFIETIGASPRVVPDEELFGLVNSYKATAVDEALRKIQTKYGIDHPFANGNQVLHHLYKYMREGNLAHATHGPLVFPKGQLPHMWRIDTRQLQPRHIKEALGDVIPGITDEAALEIYGALRTGHAWGSVDFHFLKPITSARALGRAMRLNALPGFSDLIRSWHSAERNLTDPLKILSGKTVYRPTADLAMSVERNRFVSELGEIAGRYRLDKGRRQWLEFLFDWEYRSLHRIAPEEFPTPDLFFKNMRAEYLTSIAEVAEASGQLKRVWSAPRMASMQRLANKYFKAGKDWYPDARDGIMAMFAGTEFTLRNGEKVNGSELMFRVLAVTSGGDFPKTNMTRAMRVVKSFLDDPERLTYPARNSKQVREIVESLESVPNSQKFGPYYRALKGDLNQVVIDRRMAQFFGLDPAFTPAEAKWMEQEVRALADRMGTKPAEAQAMLWMAFSERFEDLAKFYKTRNPQLSKRFKEIADGVWRDPTGSYPYSHYLGRRQTREVSGAAFAKARPKDLPAFTYYSQAEIRRLGLKPFLSRDGDAGFMIAPDGEIMNFFAPTGKGGQVLEEAVYLGGNKVTYYDMGGLDDFYKRLGFKETARRAYDPELARTPIDSAPDYVEATYKGKASFGRSEQEALELIRQNVSPMGLMQIVEGRVLGQLEFGGDFGSVIRAFQDGDFATVAHEAAHLFRISLPESELLKVEAMMGVRPMSDLIDDLGPTAAVRPVTDDHIAEMLARGEQGGFTFDPHTGQFLDDPAGFAVGMTQDSFRKIRLAGKNAQAETREAVDELLQEWQSQFGHERVKVGGWKDSEGTLHLDPSEIVEDFDRARIKAALRHQRSIYDFRGALGTKDSTFYFTPGQWSAMERGWTPEFEERFAGFLNEVVWEPLGKGQWSGLRGSMRKFIGGLYHHIRPWAVNGGYIPNSLRAHYDDIFMDSLKEMGYAPRKSDLMTKQVAAGSVLGAAEGAMYGDEPWSDALAGAAWGAAGGFALKKALRHTYGYLPDYLSRVNMALRYTFSATFDAGRYVEQNSLAAAKFGIRPTFTPKRALRKRVWKSPFVDYEVTGEEAVRHGMRLWDTLYGGGIGKWVDDTDRRAFQLGLLGFSPRHFEAYQAMELYQRGWPAERIKEAVSQIGRYGLGRAGVEKSINFVFFPFSFSKKLITSLGDWTIQQPGRNLLITEGVRRYHESSLDEGFHDLIEKHAPLLEQLWMVNNLAFGISPGRWFLEGIADNRSAAGKAGQIIGSIFIPSGAATPLAKGIGAMGDLSVNAFVPLVLTGESINRAGGVDSMDDIIRRYIPLVREIGTYWDAFNEQRVAVMQGQTPWSQFQEYQEEARLRKERYDPIAWAMGYMGADGLFGSTNPVGMAFRQQYEEDITELRGEYPTGFQMTTEFTNTAAVDDQALAELAAKENKSAAEEAIIDLSERQYSLKLLARVGGIPSELIERVLASQMYGMARKWADDDRFAELWDRFFMRDYGPIRRVA